MCKIDKDIYLDVDGTLIRNTFCDDSIGVGIREDMVEFIRFLVNNFKNVYWFSTNKKFCLNGFKKIAGEELNSKVKYKEFEYSKYEILDFSRSFYIFDDELRYDYFYSLGLLQDELPVIEQEPYKSKINSKIHNLYYIPSNAPMDYLKKVIEDVKKKENIK